VDAIVCAVDNTLNLAVSGSSTRAILSHGGNSIQTECKTKFPNGIEYGSIVSVHGGKLRCKKLYFIAIPDFVNEDGAEKDQVKHCSSYRLIFSSI